MKGRRRLVNIGIISLLALILAGCANEGTGQTEEPYVSEYVSKMPDTQVGTETAEEEEQERPSEFSVLAETYEFYAEDWETAYRQILDNLDEILYDPCGMRESMEGYPIDVIFLLLYDFNSDGTPEMVVGDWIDIDVYTFQSGLCERVATVFYPVTHNDMGDFMEPVSGVTVCNGNLYTSNGGSGEWAGEYLMFGYSDGGYHIAETDKLGYGKLDGNSVSEAEIFDFFPHAIYEGISYVSVESDWTKKHAVVRMDGEMLFKEESDDGTINYTPVDFEQFWKDLYTEDWEKAYIELLYNRDEVLSNPGGERGDNQYPIDYLRLFIHDFDSDGIPELVVGDRYAVDVYTVCDGKYERLASLNTPDEYHMVKGIALCDNCLYLSDGDRGGERSYCVFGYFDGGYHTLYINEYMDGTLDGNPISSEAALQYIPNVLTNGEYVWEIAQDDWIVECYDIKNEDGKVYIKSQWEYKNPDYEVVDFEQLQM